MKRKLALLVIVGLLMIGIQSCKKYEDGPLISLHSKTHRLVNTWKVENYKIDGVDFTSLVSNYTETFTENGNYSYQWGIFSGTGNWSFQNNYEEIRVIGVSHQESETFYILKLEEKQLWYFYMDGNTRNEIHLIQQ